MKAPRRPPTKVSAKVSAKVSGPWDRLGVPKRCLSDHVPRNIAICSKPSILARTSDKNRTPHNRHSKDETATFAFIYKSHTGVPKTTFKCSERPSYKCRIINIPQVFDSLLNGRFPHFWTALEHPQKSKFWFRSNAIKTKETSTNVPFQDPYACISHSNCNGFALLDFLPNRPSQDPSQERKSKRRANTIETNEKSPKVPPESIPNEHNCQYYAGFIRFFVFASFPSNFTSGAQMLLVYARAIIHFCNIYKGARRYLR